MNSSINTGNSTARLLIVILIQVLVLIVISVLRLVTQRLSAEIRFYRVKVAISQLVIVALLVLIH